MDVKILIFWTMISFVVGIGTNLIVANMWDWFEKIPTSKPKQVIMRYRQSSKMNQLMFASMVTTLIAALLGSLIFG